MSCVCLCVCACVQVGDKLGPFNVTLNGHSDCVRYVRSFNKPTIVLGGGGYTMRNVARCWALETAVVVGEEIPNALPAGDEYLNYYGAVRHTAGSCVVTRAMLSVIMAYRHTAGSYVVSCVVCRLCHVVTGC